jgi:hypothetical protein
MLSSRKASPRGYKACLIAWVAWQLPHHFLLSWEARGRDQTGSRLKDRMGWLRTPAKKTLFRVAVGSTELGELLHPLPPPAQAEPPEVICTAQAQPQPPGRRMGRGRGRGRGREGAFNLPGRERHEVLSWRTSSREGSLWLPLSTVI